MQLKRLLKDDDAVSPVIGVILMVAITVILAAVIASFVLGLGQNAATQNPQASFTFDYEQTNGSPSPPVGVLTIAHDGGDTIEAQELYVRGSGFDSTVTADLNEAGAWSETSGDDNSHIATEGISSGDRITVGVNSEYEIDLVWEPQEQDTSATLQSNSGPDA